MVLRKVLQQQTVTAGSRRPRIYGAAAPTFTVSDQSPQQNGIIILNGSGFDPNVVLTAWLEVAPGSGSYYTIGGPTTNSSGVFSGWGLTVGSNVAVGSINLWIQEPNGTRTPTIVLNVTTPGGGTQVSSLFSSEIQLQTAAQATGGGYAKIAFVGSFALANMLIGSTGEGCPPATSCVGPYTVNLGDTLYILGILFDCNNNALNYGSSGYEGQTVRIHTGACGDAGTDNILATGTITSINGFTPWGVSILSVGFTITLSVTSTLINYIQTQVAAGKRASLYAEIL